MKRAIILTAAAAFAIAPSLHAQTVSTRAPVIVRAEYVSSASPLSDGSVVQTVYVADTNTTSTAIIPPDSSAVRGSSSVAQPVTVTTPATATRAFYVPANTTPNMTTRMPIRTVSGTTTVIEQPAQVIPPPPGNPMPVPAGPVMVQQPAIAVSVPVTKPKTVYRPILPIGHVPPEAYVSQGMFGQPKAYVEGQHLRNFFRYILP